MDIDCQKLFSMLEEFSKIGRSQNGGITRKGFSPEEREAHQLARKYMEEGGLTVRVDGAGNTIGRWGKPGQAALIIGSHLDSVSNGGSFDGVLGVAAGIACVVTLIQTKADLPWAIEVIAFSDEEGAYWGGTLGSRAMTGRLTEKEFAEEINGAPNPLMSAMKKAGLNISDLGKARRNPEEFIAYLELHVEQGPMLEKMKKEVGVVTEIPSLFRYRIHVTGIPDHPGTTPFSLRDDALKKASRLLEKSYELFSKKEGALMGNFGDIRIGPGGFNVVPAKAVLNLELRSTSYDLLEETEETFLKMAHQIDPGITTEKVLKKRGVPMDGRMIEAIVASLKDLGYGYAFMPSGAGHDVTSFVPTVPTGMIFVPSIDGKSHSPLEYSSPEAVTAGARTLLATLLRLGDKVLSAS